MSDMGVDFDVEFKNVEPGDPVVVGGGEVFRSDGDRKSAVDYLIAEIDAVKNLREKRTRRVNKWRRMAEVRPESEEKNFPWPKASNIVTQMMLTNVNGMTAALKAAYDQKKPFYHVSCNDGKYIKHEKALERYIDYNVSSKQRLNLLEKKNELFYETVLLGTKMVVMAWDNDTYEYKRKRNGVTEVVSAIRHRGPKIISVPDESFYAREYVTDLNDAPWFAMVHHMTWQELKRRESQGIYKDVELIKENGVKSRGENEELDRSRAGIETGTTTDLYEIAECYLFWDVENDGKMVDVKVWFDLGSGVVLREEYNDLGIRNIAVGRYLVIPGQFYGMGVGWICENAQDANDALTNMAINSTHISSLQGYITRRGSGIAPNTKFRPLFQLECDNPRDDFQVAQFPNTIQPNMMMAGIIRNDNDRAVGANNALLGFPDTIAKSGGTASGYMFQAQQSSRTFNSVVENTDMWLNEIIMLFIYQSALHKDEIDFSVMGQEDEILLKEVFDLAPEEIVTKFAFSITTTEVEETEEARRQAILTLSQLYSMYGQKLLQLQQGEIQLLMPFAQMMPQLQSRIQEALITYLNFSDQLKVGTNSLMKDILKYFEVDSSDKLANTKKIQMMLEFMNAMQDMQLGGIQNALRQSGGEFSIAGGQGQGPGGLEGGRGDMGGANGYNSAGNYPAGSQGIGNGVS